MRLSRNIIAIFAILLVIGLVIGGLWSIPSAQAMGPDDVKIRLDTYKTVTDHDFEILPVEIGDACLSGRGVSLNTETVWEAMHIACVPVDGVLIAYECRRTEIIRTTCVDQTWHTDKTVEDLTCQPNPAYADLCEGIGHSGVVLQNRELVRIHILR